MDGHSWHFTGGSDQDHRQEKEMQKGKVDPVEVLEFQLSYFKS